MQINESKTKRDKTCNVSKLFSNLGFLPEWPVWTPPRRSVCCTPGPECSRFSIRPGPSSQHPASRQSIRLPRLNSRSDNGKKEGVVLASLCTFLSFPNVIWGHRNEKSKEEASCALRQHACQFSCLIHCNQNTKQKKKLQWCQRCSVPTCSKTQLHFVLQDIAYVQDATAQPA